MPRRLKVGVLSTGDELVVPGRRWRSARLRFQSRLLAGLLAAQGVTMVAARTAGDAAAALEARLRQAAAKPT